MKPSEPIFLAVSFAAFFWTVATFGEVIPDRETRDVIRQGFGSFYQKWTRLDYVKASEYIETTLDMSSPSKLQAFANAHFDRRHALRIVSFRERTGRWVSWPEFYHVEETVSFLIPVAQTPGKYRLCVLQEIFHISLADGGKTALVTLLSSEDITTAFVDEHQQSIESLTAIANDTLASEKARADAMFRLVLELFYTGEYSEAWPYISRLDAMGLHERERKSHDHLWGYLIQARHHIDVPDGYLYLVRKYFPEDMDRIDQIPTGGMPR